LKILFPFVGDSVGGSHLSSIELYKILIEKGYDVIVTLHNGKGPLSKLLKEYGIDYYEIDTSFLAGDSPNKVLIILGVLKNILPLVRFIKKHKIDIVHGNDLRIKLTWSIPAKLSGAQLVWHQRTILSRSSVWKIIPFLCNHFIATSESVLKSTPKTFDKRKISLIYNPFETDKNYDFQESRREIIDRFNIRSDAIVFGYVGRLVGYKNIDFLIRCFEELVFIHKKRVHLLVIGTGDRDYSEALVNMVDSAGLDESITFCGFISRPLKLICGMDVVVASSTIDAFGRTLVEAMLQSTTVIASDKGGHLEIVEDGSTGLLYKANDKESFVQNALMLIEEESLRERLSEEGLKRNIERFSKEKHYLAVEKVYKTLTES